MGRWQPDARGRLGHAAMELYTERGYEQTTVAEIAERAGLTARTFFRYFTDKREVLFAGSDAMGEHLTGVLASAPAGTRPLDAVALALGSVTALIGDDHDHSAHRQAVIDAHADLRERERTKLASWSVLLADGLRRRGVDDPAASLAAEAGMAVFRVAFERWVAGTGNVGLTDVLDESFEQLRSIAGGS